MARSLEAARLTEAHRVAQNELRAAAMREVLSVLQGVDVQEVDRDFPRFLTAVLPILRERHRESALVAVEYLRQYRAAERVPGRLNPVRPDTLTRDLILPALVMTVPAAYKKSRRLGRDVNRSRELMQAQALRSVGRMVLAGGRDTIVQTLAADPRAEGFARIASAGACDFCSSKASVRVNPSASFECHDGCSCTAEPVFR